MKKIVCLKNSDGLRPATPFDAEELNVIANGDAVTVRITAKNQRSLAMHRMYWALVQLALDYWKPDQNAIYETEKQFALGLQRFVSNNGLKPTFIKDLLEMYMEELQTARTTYVQDIPRTAAALHQWIKEQVGYYDIVLTPSGIEKQTRSIAFDAMSHEEWKAYYNSAFNVVWEFVFSQVFHDQKQAQNAIDQLSAMGQ